jgi:hypothetical protein
MSLLVASARECGPGPITAASSAVGVSGFCRAFAFAIGDDPSVPRLHGRGRRPGLANMDRESPGNESRFPRVWRSRGGTPDLHIRRSNDGYDGSERSKTGVSFRWRSRRCSSASAGGASPLPAHQGIVAAYLSHLASSGQKASSIGRRAAAIAWKHRHHGHEPPTAVSEAVNGSIFTGDVAPPGGFHDRPAMTRCPNYEVFGEPPETRAALAFRASNYEGFGEV